MIPQIVIYIIAGIFIMLGLVLFIKPSLLAKDKTKPLTIRNFDFKGIFIGDWKSFLIFLLLMFLVWSYANDTAACRELIANFEVKCSEWMATQQFGPTGGITFINGTEIGENIPWGGDQLRITNNVSFNS